MKKTMLLLFALMLSSAICAQDYHVVLWDNTTAPTSNGLSGDEVESKPGQWKNTQTAEMWIYTAGDTATGQALVFFPGGGYSSLSVGNGHKEAQWFAHPVGRQVGEFVVVDRVGGLAERFAHGVHLPVDELYGVRRRAADEIPADRKRRGPVFEQFHVLRGLGLVGPRYFHAVVLAGRQRDCGR